MRRLVIPLVILAAAVCISQGPAEAPTTAPKNATAPVRAEFHVKFISGANVYIDGGRRAGLAEGTKLILKQDPQKLSGDPSNAALQPGIVAKLTAVSVASTSADPASIPKELQAIVPVRLFVSRGQLGSLGGAGIPDSPARRSFGKGKCARLSDRILERFSSSNWAPWKIEWAEMVVQGFENSLDSLKSTKVRTSNPEWFPEPGIAPVELYFSDGSRMRANYWRIIRDDKAHTSSFDHQQKYGLPAPIDAFAQIAEALDGTSLREAKWDARTGDVILSFEPNVELQVFNFTGYEDWEIHFSNGTGEYSPYAR